MGDKDQSIHELLVQLKQGNAEAADKAVTMIYARMVKRLYELATDKNGRFRLTHEDAEDAIQDTFIHIRTRAINSYAEEKRGGQAWIEQIFNNHVIDWRRRSYRRQVREVTLDDPNAIACTSEDENPEQFILTEEQEENIRRTWEALSEEDKIEIAVKGRGRGGTREKPGRKAYNAAKERAQNIFHTLSEPDQQP
jgi:RNA polymerase sigma factor (sigma-70 family)